MLGFQKMESPPPLVVCAGAVSITVGHENRHVHVHRNDDKSRRWAQGGSDGIVRGAGGKRIGC